MTDAANKDFVLARYRTRASSPPLRFRQEVYGTDVRALLRQALPLDNTLGFPAARAVPVEALYIGRIGMSDHTFLLYAYVQGGCEYGFAWETHWDETHRAFDPYHHEWYDELVPATSFDVVIAENCPPRHLIIEPAFQAMAGVLYVGRFQAMRPGPSISASQRRVLTEH